MNKIRPIAIHLPQFHPIPENDLWWGKGFTEWTNVTKAKPLFEGHYQPHLPADLGFYDLRLSEAREAQAALAKEYGIYGFCYYHYWFSGKRILERPVEEILKSGKPDFPFMLCWANENWTRRWDGGDKTILMKQEYSFEDDINHIRALMPYFRDSRYIKVNGKPVFAIYKASLFPDIKRTIELWRKEALREGIELYLCMFETTQRFTRGHKDSGFDAAIEFQPSSLLMADYFNDVLQPRLAKRLAYRIQYRYHSFFGDRQKIAALKMKYRHVYDYSEYVNFAMKSYSKSAGFVRFPCVMPSWDNTARVGKGAFIFKDSSPEKFGEWLEFHIKHLAEAKGEENLVFINAWNEWAEGNHLEPDQKFGRAYLEAVGKFFKS